jgi:hypothetical protein
VGVVQAVLNLTPIQLAIAVGAFAALLVFVVRLCRRTKNASLAEIVTTVLAGAGIVAGFRVMVLAWSEQFSRIFPNDPIYVLIGGVAVVWVSVNDIFQKMTAE